MEKDDIVLDGASPERGKIAATGDGRTLVLSNA